MEPVGSLPHSQVLTVWMFLNRIHFFGEELLALRPTPKLENHPLSAARDCFINVFAATLRIGVRLSIRNLRMRHAVVKGTHLSRIQAIYANVINKI